MLSLITARIVGIAAEDTLFFHLLFLDFWSQTKPCLPSFLCFAYKTGQRIAIDVCQHFCMHVCVAKLSESKRSERCERNNKSPK